MTPEEEALVRKRQRGKAIAMALLLLGFVILIYFVTIAKISVVNG